MQLVTPDLVPCEMCAAVTDTARGVRVLYALAWSAGPYRTLHLQPWSPSRARRLPGRLKDDELYLCAECAQEVTR